MHDTLKKIILQKEIEVAHIKESLLEEEDSPLENVMRGKIGHRKIKSLKKDLNK